MKKNIRTEETKEKKRIARQNMMLNESVGPLIIKMAIPTMISFLITAIYSLADTFFVSMLGTNAASAVGVNTSLDQIIMMAGSMLAVGSASYISRLLGAGDKDKASEVHSTSWFSALIFGVVILVFGKIFIGPLVDGLGATPACKQYSMDYATYVLYAAPFMATSFVMNQSLRSEGSPMLSTIGMGAGGIINCILDPFFIFKEVPIFGLTLPGLGLEVAGASIATAISKVISCMILLFPYLAKTTNISLSIKKINYVWKDVKEVVSIGSSSLFRTGLSIVAAVILNHIAGGISDSLLAAVGVTTKIIMLPFGFLLGFGIGYQPVAGFAWGAKNYSRLRKVYTFAWKAAILGATVMGLLMCIFAKPIVGLFSVNDAELIKWGSLILIFQCAVLPAQAWVMIVNMLCSALGEAKGAIILALSRQGICFIPIVFPLAMFFNEMGVCMSQGLADLISVIIAIPILKNVKKMIEKAEEECCKTKIQNTNPRFAGITKDNFD